MNTFGTIRRNFSTSFLAKNVENSKDDISYLQKDLRANLDISILTGDKNSSVAISDKSDYQKLVQKMIDEGIEDGIYVQIEDTIIKDFTSF